MKALPRAGEAIDISLAPGPLLPPWPGDPPFSLAECGTPPQRLSAVSFCLHHGTHLDAPAHCLPDGKTIDAYPPARFDLPALLVDCPGTLTIGAALLAGAHPAPGGALLLHTGFRRGPAFDPAFPGLTGDAAAWLVNAGISLVGIDTPSIESAAAPGLPVHHLLLTNDILILEQLDLAAVPAGHYRLRCAPLVFSGAEAGPCRALLYPPSK